MSAEWVSASSANPEPADSDSDPDPDEVTPTATEPGSPEPAVTEPSQASWPQPIGRPARPHWWSIQKPAPAGPISARRAYLEVFGVFVAFFAAGIVAGGETLARRYSSPSGSWAVFTPAAISELTMAGLAVAVTVLLSSRRGITPRKLGLRLPRNASGGVATGPAFRMGVWAIVVLAVGGVITSALAGNRHLVQPTVQDNSYLMYATAASVAAGVIEETVVLAFVVTTLRQAGRPLAEILAVAVLLRCSYHDYYGPGVIGIAVWAALFVWLFLRTGSVIPLVVVHFLWDVTIFWEQRWHWLNAVRVLGALLLVAVATFTWLAEVSKRKNPRPRPNRSGATYTAWPFTDEPNEPNEPNEPRQRGLPDELYR
ncbi:MAG TPA: CPBP family glutamic-type intramembrane protease [Streptosporangiaceae bacterium]|nr:CPBP family glutamic-type intramembrane protease [Streptosporangiaceae bacterium]